MARNVFAPRALSPSLVDQMSPLPCRFEVTLSEVLALLRERDQFTEAFLSADYTIWAGAGISAERLPGVRALLDRLLRHLHAGADFESDDCPYRRALEEVLALAEASGAAVDPSSDPDSWPIDPVTAELSSRYSQVLEVRVRPAGTAALDIVWDILDIPHVYADECVEYDAEHLFLALMIEEGVLSAIVTPNWDPLIEKAHERIAPAGEGATPLRVVIRPDELEGLGGETRYLLKPHGCARRAVDDREVYGPFLVAQESDLVRWGRDDLTEPIADYLSGLLRTSRSLLVGLAVQDDNLKRLVQRIRTGREAPLAAEPPKIAFCTEQITPNYERILRLVHGDYDERRDELVGPACLPPCSKPLLGGLFVETVLAKARVLVDRARDDDGFPEFAGGELDNVLDELESRLVSAWDEADQASDRWRRLATELPPILSRLFCLYRDQALPTGVSEYRPILPGNLRWLRTQRGPNDSGLHRSFLIVAAVLRGEQAGYWTVGLGTADAPSHEVAQVELRTGERTARLFICQDWEVARSRLYLQGILDQVGSRDGVVVHPVGAEPKKRRAGPLDRALPDSEDRSGELWAADLAMGCESVDELAVALRDELLACGAL